MKSENKNFLYNIIYQLLAFIIPFVTVPYVSRVLGVENVGAYSYTYSIVYMFMLIGMLGINNYGNRAIAAVRDDYEKLSLTFYSIYGMQLIINVVVVVAYLLYMLLICHEYMVISWIQGLFLLSICFDVNWFFFGIEKFKLTIIRNFIIKVISVISVFIFVKTPNDLWLYTLIMAGATLLSQMFLVAILPNYVKFRLASIGDMLSHFKEIVILFVPVLAFGIYKVMDKTMIGIFSNVSEVGYYENAEKIMNIPSAIIAALGTVMLPRMSYLFTKENADFKKAISDSMKLASKMSIIMGLGLMLIAKDAVIVLFGPDFEKCGLILTLLSLTVIASAWANVIRTQYLIPLKKNGIYIRSTIGAAVVNLFLNIIFIRYFAAIGACIGTIFAEYFVMIYQLISTRKELDYKEYFKFMVYDFLKTAAIIIITIIFTLTMSNICLRLILRIVIAVILFFVFNRRYIIREFLNKTN